MSDRLVRSGFISSSRVPIVRYHLMSLHVEFVGRNLFIDLKLVLGEVRLAQD